MYRVIGSRKEKKRQQPTQKRKVAWLLWLHRIVASLFLATVVYVLFFSPQLAIVSVKIYGLDRLAEGPIRSMVDSEISEKYLNLINKNNLILLRKKEIREVLVGNFKRIEDVQIKKVFPNAVEIFIKERKLSMLLCGSTVCYILDENGTSYPASNFTQEELAVENLITLNDSSNSQVDDKKPLEDGFRLFILGLAEAVQSEAGIYFKKTYETSNRMSGDLKVEMQDGWAVYFNESVGLEKSASVLHAVLENKIEKERQKDLEYIDLRVDNKVFYKFKNGTQNTVEDVENKTLEEDKKEDKKKN